MPPCHRYGWIFAAILVPSLAFAFPTGPPDGVTGAPGEMVCAQAFCHSNLNTGNGSVNIVAPAWYGAGDTIDVNVNLEDPGQQRWGFELTVLDGSDQPVGQILVTEVTRTQLSTDIGTGREYIKHTLAGTDPGTPDVAPGWTFQWIAPAASGAGDITFYGAGNAANNNDLPTGDFIYTTSAPVGEAFTSVEDGNLPRATPARLDQNSPNPFNPVTKIRYTLAESGAVTIDVYGLNGRLVRTLVDEYQQAGAKQVTWNGTDESGRAVPSGIYLAILSSGETKRSIKMSLIR